MTIQITNNKPTKTKESASISGWNRTTKGDLGYGDPNDNSRVLVIDERLQQKDIDGNFNALILHWNGEIMYIEALDPDGVSIGIESVSFNAPLKAINFMMKNSKQRRMPRMKDLYWLMGGH